MIKNSFFISFVALVLSACASSNPYLISENNEIINSNIEVVDNRGESDIKGGLPLFGDPTYSVPDARFSPALIEMLKSELAKHFGSSIDGKVLTIDEFSVDNYFGKTYKRNQAVSGVIVIGDSNEKDAVIVNLSGNLDGVKFDSKIVSPYSATPGPTYLGMHYDLPESRLATKKAVSKAISDVVSKLGKK